MLYAMIPMMPVPPIHAATASSDVIFGMMFGLFVALFLLATTLWIIGERHIAHKPSQVKEAEWQIPLQPLYVQPQIYDTSSQIHASEEKVLVRR